MRLPQAAVFLPLRAHEFYARGEDPKLSVESYKLIDFFKEAEIWIVDRIFWEDLPVPQVDEFQASRR